MSEADTEYLDFSPASPLKCDNFDENCFCHHTDEISSSLSMSSSSGVNVIKRSYNTNRRMIKIRIKTSSSKECSVEGESTENGIKICISPRNAANEKFKPNKKCALNETYSITASEMGSSSVETDYEFRKNIKNELKRSPAAVKVLNYLESLSEHHKKKTPEKILGKTKSNQRTSDPKTVPLTTQVKSRRSKSKTPTTQSVNSAVDDDEFHDCCDKTVISSGTSEYEDTTESFDTSQGMENLPIEAPLITITQEMSAQMVVTSKFEINKQKLKRMNEQRERRQSKESRGSPEKIIDDNFCNEILDKMNQFKVSDDHVLSEHEEEDTDSIEKVPFDTTLETSTTSSGPQKPPRTFAYRRSHDNNKPPKQREIRSSLESLDMYLYEEMKQLKLFRFNQNRKSIQQMSVRPVDESNYVVGGWKVSPDTKPVVTVPNSSTHDSAPTNNKCEIGWTSPVQSPKKFEPGWVQPTSSIPPDILQMLHYSDDEMKKRSISSSNARAQPQQKYPSSSEK